MSLQAIGYTYGPKWSPMLGTSIVDPIGENDMQDLEDRFKTTASLSSGRDWDSNPCITGGDGIAWCD